MLSYVHYRLKFKKKVIISSSSVSQWYEYTYKFQNALMICVEMLELYGFDKLKKGCDILIEAASWTLETVAVYL